VIKFNPAERGAIYMVYRTCEAAYNSDGRLSVRPTTADTDSLPENELIINVKYTSLNLMDAFVCSGRLPKQKYPICPGVDAIGEVVSSKSADFSIGDEVAVTGCGIGTTLPGGYGEYISASADSAATLPIGLSMKTAAAFGSAGTAVTLGQIIFRNMGITGKKAIAVTGASCDIGALAVSVFSHLGYSVTAIVKNDDAKDFVSQLNIDAVKTEAEIFSDRKKGNPQLFDGVFDSVGGELLAALTERLNNDGIALAAGVYENPSVTLSLNPFVEKRVGLMGISGLYCDIETKTETWQIISSELVNPYIDWICADISARELEKYLPLILSGELKGRMVIDHNA
jgi:putative YhdH/YhfP family quinone oxidoreductase